ncbi:Pre-mRNA-processing factor 19 [Naviculisporaceae sp. PSN 640]
MLCALSGEIPEEPVISKKTGVVFEKRLILKYIEENGKEPGTDEELDPEDLLPVKTSRVPQPRPPNFTSLPSLLKAFQNEWDAIVLDAYNVREQLKRTREELATALYQHDAAVRVIARLTKERDEARDALSKLTIAQTGASAGAGSDDAMAVDNLSLPESLQEHVDEVQQRLSKGRKKRPVPPEWATPDDISTFGPVGTTELTITQPETLAVQQAHAAIGGLDGKLDIYSIDAKQVERSLDIGEPITATVWTENKVFLATSKGSVRALVSGEERANFQAHAGQVTGLSLHPGGRIVASTGVDKSFVFYDIEELKVVSHIYTDIALTASAFHPDGHLFAAGTQSGDVKIFETKTGQLAATFTLGVPVDLIVFSENGYWFAAAGRGEPTVTIFDLRKTGEAAKVKEFQIGNVRAMAWDYTAQYLAISGESGTTVQQYLKSSKSWSEPLRNGVSAIAVGWGADAKTLVTVDGKGVVNVLGVTE